MPEHDPTQDETTDDGYIEIDPEGPDALDLLRAAAADAEEDAAAVKEGQDELSQVRAERDDLEQKLLRVSADYQNFARRAQQNITAAGEQKAFDMAKALVTVLDHFDRALEAAGTQAEDAAAGGGGDDLQRGVTMVHSELLATLGRFGIQRLDVQPGDTFDPVKHEALMRQPSDDVESGHITMQMLPGYVLGEKVVRPAQVGVAE